MTQDSLTGRIIGGYQLIRRLGRGGMASVYLAHDQKLQREVAVKLLHGVDATDPSFRARFEQEALATARLDHPNIVHIYDYGHEDDLTFMVMEYCPNGTLLDLMSRSAQQGKPIEPDYAVYIIGQIALALDFAHQHGIIHRDVKPSNILFAKDGRPVLADLGISKALAGPKLTRTQTTVGTPEYMSPEQGRGDPLDQRSDLYSLGVVLYEMLAGRPPYQADTPWGVIYKHMSDTPPPIRQQNPRVSVALGSVSDRAMAKKPAERFQSGREMAEALQLAQQRPNQPIAAQPGRHATTTPRPITADSPTVFATTATPHPLPASKPESRPGASALRWLLPVAAVLMALAVVFAVFVLPKMPPESAGPPIVEDRTDPLATVAPGTIALEPTSTTVPGETSTVVITEMTVVLPTKGPLPPTLPAPEETTIFQWQPIATVDEEFTQPSAGWPSLENDSSRWRVEDGAYRLTIIPPNSMVSTKRGLDIGDFSLAIDARNLSDDPNLRYGLLFRNDKAGNFYRLDYAPGLGAELSKRVGGKDTVLISRAEVKPRRSDSAPRLRVEASGSRLQVFFDGQPVGEVTDDSLARGDLALYGISGEKGQAEFAFNAFHLEPLASEAIPVVLAPYKDPDGLFNLHVPQDWKPGIDDLGTNFEAPNHLSRVLVFKVTGTTSGDDPVEVARKALAQAQSMYPDFSVGGGEKRQLASLPAYEQSLTGQVLGMDVKARLVTVNQSGRGYAIVTVAQAAEDAALQPLMAYIVDTFRPADAPTPTTAPTSSPSTATPVPTPAQPMAVAEKQTLNVRGGPGTDYPIVGAMREGDQAEIIGLNGDSSWWQVVLANGTQGWVSASLVTTRGPVEQVTAEPTTMFTSTPKVPPAPVRPGLVFDFEQKLVWTPGNQKYGTMAQSNEQAKAGTYSGKLSYNFKAVIDNFVVLKPAPAPALGNATGLTAWVYGDGAKHYLNVWVLDNAGEERSYSFGQINHSGWQPMTAWFDDQAAWPPHISGPDNGKLDLPSRFVAFVLDGVPDGQASQGVIYIDEVYTTSEAIPSVQSNPGGQPQPSSPTTGTAIPEAPVQPPQPAALSGHILFTSGSDVSALDVASGNTWPVFRNSRQPDIRADGRVVVNGTGGGKDNMFSVNLDGSRDISNSPHPEDSYPHWSPSGQSAVLYSTLQGDGIERIYIQWDMTHSEEPKPLKVSNTDVLGRDPTWLQDWRIAFSGCNYWTGAGSLCGIWAVDSNGKGSQVQLTERLDDRSTDSFGGTLLLSSQATGNWDVYAVSVNGGGLRNLTNSPSQDAGATFSPNGGSIAFMSNRDGGWGIWVMNTDGSNPRKVLAVPNGFGGDWAGERLAWGP